MRGRTRPILAGAAALAVLSGLAVSAPAYAANPPLAGAVHYASDLEWQSMTNGWGPVERDWSNGGQAAGDANRFKLTIGGVVYEKGLGAHAPSSVVYALDGQCRQFLSDVGVDAGQNGKGRVDFKVLVDGVERFAAARKGTDGALPVNLDLQGAQRIELRVEAGPEGNGNDHADWAGARFNCTDAYVADPLRIAGDPATNLGALVPGAPATVTVRGLAPLAEVSLELGDAAVATGTADAQGVAAVTFVVPADAPGGATTLRASGAALFDVAAEGETAVSVVTISDRSWYVDCEAGAPGDGSEEAPFDSIAAVNEHGAFQPGERILFKSGTTCVGALTPTGSGVAGHPITVASYGGDAMPTIDGAGAVAAVRITNASHWTVTGLHVVNPSDTPTRRVGILYENTSTTQHAGVVISGNHVEDVAGWRNKATNGAGFAQSAGIMVRTEGKGAFDGITIVDNEVNDTAGGGVKISAPDYTDRYNTQVVIARNLMHQVGGDGIVMHNSDGGLVEHNTALDLGAGKHPYEGGNFAGMWSYNSKNPVFQFNVVGNSTTSVYDSTAWDCDMRIVGTCLYQYNYSFGNAGGFYLNCVSNCGGGATTTTVVLRYNVAQDDCRLGGSSSGTGKHLIYNNTFYCPSRVFLDDMKGPREMRNNLIVAPGGAMNAASNVAYQTNAWFGGIQPPAAETGSVLADPQLVAGGSGQRTLDVPGYRLAEGSPLLGAGTPVAGAGDRDYFGNGLPAGAPNIGADQGAGVPRVALPFEQLVNQTSVASAVNPRNGAVTADRRTIPEEGLAEAGLVTGQQLTAFGVTLPWHATPVGTPDTVKAAGQELAISGSGRTLVVVGFATGDADASGTITVHYTNGKSEELELTLPNWRTGEAVDENTVLVARSAWQRRHTQPYIGGASTVQRIDETASVFAVQLPLNPTRTVESITLPGGSALVDSGLNLMGVGIGRPLPGTGPGKG
ncbi:NPCBM/NEW2 domain-containing protein [Agromyces soli]